MSKKTACPLDCYDACEIIYESGTLKGRKEGHTDGFLCPNLNHYSDYETIQRARYRGKEITLEEALLQLKEIIKKNSKEELLHYRGHGNFALMQGITDHFFASFGATLTDGSLCDGAGEAGILKGRGSNKNMPIGEIGKSEVVIFWGRNPHTTSSHILPYIKGKQIIVIDPVKTKIAKAADLYIQLKPQGDKELAMILSHFLHLNGEYDEAYLKEFAGGYKEYCKLIENLSVEKTLGRIDVRKEEVEAFLKLVRAKRVAIVCGLGIQKYSDGADAMRAVDAFAVMLGLFGREGCGVSYLGASKEGIESPFNTKSKKVSKVDTEFSSFKTVFIQGTNLLSQMPDSIRVKESISKVENVVYFGLYENETSEAADLVIPAKSFLYKNDVRTSYSHNIMSLMPKVEESDIGISEYDLASYLCGEFGVELYSEEFYLKHFEKFAVEIGDEYLHVDSRDEIAYMDKDTKKCRGFDTEDGEFAFLQVLDSKPDSLDGMYLITPKSLKSLNSQFKREESLYLHSSLGYAEEELLRVSSEHGSVELRVKHNDDLRSDSVLIYSGTRGVNNLTTSKHSVDGKCAIYQESRVEISRV